MKIVSISDTHERENYYNIVVPEGDVLVHAGDITMGGSLKALNQFANWIKKHEHKHKIVISGNHDWCFQNQHHDIAVEILENAGIVYLQDSGIEIDGINFWGSPWQPWFHDWAFNLRRGREIAEKWKMIPNNCNVLVTHGPPYGILDSAGLGEHVGCEALEKRIRQLDKLKVHIFGHIHEQHGVVHEHGIIFANASTCTRRYEPNNPPIVIEI